LKSNELLISIITPCYNSEKFIVQTIESIIDQTYLYWELLIIDDCSTDNTISIIKEYLKKDERIKLFSTTKNSKSPVEPRNIGIKSAQGRYIAFLDSDDIWLPSKLEKQIKLFKNDKVAVVFSYYEKINEKGERKKRIITSPSSVTYNQLLKSNYIGCLSAMYDTSKVGKIYFNSIGHEDYAYWLTILRFGYIACNTNTVEALYRVRENSVSTNILKASKWTWNVYRKYLQLNICQSLYYFCFYLLKALQKHFK
jgi:teichuronic acid biosynthesis glycosyltransferase TuaG